MLDFAYLNSVAVHILFTQQKTGVPMASQNVRVKSDTRNHQGFFVPQSAYTLVEADQNGWALICIDNAACYYVDPDSLLAEG